MIHTETHSATSGIQSTDRDSQRAPFRWYLISAPQRICADWRPDGAWMHVCIPNKPPTVAHTDTPSAANCTRVQLGIPSGQHLGGTRGACHSVYAQMSARRCSQLYPRAAGDPQRPAFRWYSGSVPQRICADWCPMVQGCILALLKGHPKMHT